MISGRLYLETPRRAPSCVDHARRARLSNSSRESDTWLASVGTRLVFSLVTVALIVAAFLVGLSGVVSGQRVHSSPGQTVLVAPITSRVLPSGARPLPIGSIQPLGLIAPRR
jgi:hypothetical protein